MLYFHGSVGICPDFYPVAVMKYPDGSKLRKEWIVWLTIPGYSQSLQQSQGGRKSEQLITSQPQMREVLELTITSRNSSLREP